MWDANKALAECDALGPAAPHRGSMLNSRFVAIGTMPDSMATIGSVKMLRNWKRVIVYAGCTRLMMT